MGWEGIVVLNSQNNPSKEGPPTLLTQRPAQPSPSHANISLSGQVLLHRPDPSWSFCAFDLALGPPTEPMSFLRSAHVFSEPHLLVETLFPGQGAPPSPPPPFPWWSRQPLLEAPVLSLLETRVPSLSTSLLDLAASPCS